LPANGPGRNGNFVLTTIKAHLDSLTNVDGVRNLKLVRALADFSQKDFNVGGAIDADHNTGWAIHLEEGKPHFALFELAGPLRETPDMALRVTLECKSRHPQHTLGRFRLSVSTDPATFDREERRLAALKLTDSWSKLGATYALNGGNEKALEYFGKALQRADDRAGKALVIAAAAPYQTVLLELARSTANDGRFQAELTRHYAERGNNPLANAARTRARALFEAKLAKEPDNAALAAELADLLLIDTRWTILKPAEMRSAGGAALITLEDNSILASGPNPPNDVYTLTFRNPPARIRALRLEVLTHESLPWNGPGRADNGNFSLTTIKAQLDPATKPGEARSLKLVNAWADFSQNARYVAAAIDANERTGWAINHGGTSHFAVFELAEPVAVPDGTVLRVTLEFKADARYQLGRFRLSISPDPLNIEREQKHLAVPKFTQPWLKLAGAYALNGRNDKATAYFARALQADPTLCDDRQAQHRYHAARAAVLAAARAGKDEPQLDDAAKAKLRGQALDWLKAERTAWDKAFNSRPPQDRPAIVETLNAWRNEADLAGLRDAVALARLPAHEQKEWEALWARVPELWSVVPTAKEPAQKWRYTTQLPAEGWQKADFDDKEWKQGIGAFGTQEGAAVRTYWDTSDIWLRREFKLPEGKWDDLLLLVGYDDHAEVYVNGVLALQAPGPRFEEMPLRAEARKALKPGRNVLAVHCKNTGGPGYVDVGIVAVKGNAARLAYAQIAFDRRHYAFATQLWVAALASDPKVQADRLAPHRARAALLAAAGQGQNEPPPDDAAKARLRGQALAWLKAELGWLGKQLEKDRAGQRAAVEAVLLGWQKDGFLAGIRDAAALAKLPVDEQKACARFWDDVTALLMKAEGAANNAAFRLPGMGRPNSWMAQDREGKWLAIPTADKVAVFDARTGELLRTLTGHTGRVYAIAFSPDGKFLAGANWAGNASTVKVWDLKTGAVTATLNGAGGDVRGVTFSGDGKWLFGAVSGTGVRMWDMTGKLVRTFKASGNTEGLFHLALSPDGKRVVSNDTPQTVKVWEIEGDNPPVTLGGHTSQPWSAAYSPDGKLLATGSDKELLLWDAEKLKLVKKFDTPAGWLVFAPDGKTILTAQHHTSRPLEKDVVTRWDLKTYEGKPLPPLTGRTGWPVYHLSPDGKRLYSHVCDGPDAEGRIRVYDAATGADIEPFSLRALAKRFPALLRGEDKAADNAERLDFAQIAYGQNKFTFATRLWAEALATDPKLGEDLTPHRYNAARAAALAAAGQGKDEPPLDDAAKAKLRGQALGWLKAELTAWSKVPPQSLIVRTLWQWQQGMDLAGIRDRAALAELPAEEQKAFTQLWIAAADLLTEAGGFGALPAAEQVEEVRNELKKRNAGFDGSMAHKIEGGVVTELNVNGKNVTDLSPVRFLVGLKVLRCTNGPLSDLSPLKVLPLTTLDLHGTQVRDLTPLKGMPLTALHLWHCSQVQDLEPLKGMPLTDLYMNGSQVRDLMPLKDMKLTLLACNDTSVTDLSPLKGMPLKRLFIHGTGVADLKPLQGMSLEDIRLTPRNITQGLDILRGMKSLRTIGTGWFNTPTWPAAEFWARYDKGEFKK
jgi:WD40 repeat protein